MKAVSNTGAEFEDMWKGGGESRREVSGKIAEEGRAGGTGRGWLRWRKASGKHA
jgi:hypothetical protein